MTSPGRRRATWLSLWLVAAVVAPLLITGGPTADAMSPDAQGWWYGARLSGLPVQEPPPASVPDDGLFIELGPTGANALSALRGTVPSGMQSVTLHLDVVDSSGDPLVGVCPSKTKWISAQGGEWGDRPECDGDKSTAVTFNADGTAFEVDITPYVNGTTFNVLLVPGAATGGATFTVSISAPDDESVRVVLPTPPPTTQSATPTSAANPSPTTRPSTPTTQFVPRPTTSPTTVFKPASDLAVADAPSSALEIPPIADEIAAPPILEPLNRESGGAAGDSGRLIGLGMAAAVVTALFMLRGRAGPQPAPVIAIGGGGVRVDETPTLAAPASTDESIAGIGRFSRTRTGAPPPLI